MDIHINLDDLWSGDDWGTTVGEIIRTELQAAIKDQIKQKIKKDATLSKALDEYTSRAIMQMLEKA